MYVHPMDCLLIVADISREFILKVKPLFHRLIVELPSESRYTGTEFRGMFMV